MTKLTTYLATYLATNFAEMRPRLSKFSQRRLRARAEGASSHQGGFFSQRLFFGLFSRGLFSEELLLSASVLFLPVLYMTTALALLSGVGLGRWVFPTGILLWGVAVVMLHRKERWQQLLATLLLFLAVFALAAWGTSHTLDIFWDSRQYHTLALTDLLNGFNPYLHKELWHYTYPAASWLLSASLVLWTQSFETSFAFTLVAALAAFLCVRRFLFLLGLSRPWRFCLSALFVANPFTMLRMFSFYNDGILVSMLLSVFALMLCFVFDEGSHPQDKRRILRTAVLIAVLLVLLVNIKFTGLVYGGILGLTALAYGIRRGASRRLLVQLVGLGTFAFLSGVLVFGFYPYALNTMRYQNPFHPAHPLDRETLGIFEKYDPAFAAMSQYERWWNYLFGYQKKGRTRFGAGAFATVFVRQDCLLAEEFGFFLQRLPAFVSYAGVFCPTQRGVGRHGRGDGIRFVHGGELRVSPHAAELVVAPFVARLRAGGRKGEDFFV